MQLQFLHTNRFTNAQTLFSLETNPLSQTFRSSKDSLDKKRDTVYRHLFVNGRNIKNANPSQNQLRKALIKSALVDKTEGNIKQLLRNQMNNKIYSAYTFAFVAHLSQGLTSLRLNSFEFYFVNISDSQVNSLHEKRTDAQSKLSDLSNYLHKYDSPKVFYAHANGFTLESYSCDDRGSLEMRCDDFSRMPTWKNIFYKEEIIFQDFERRPLFQQ